MRSKLALACGCGGSGRWLAYLAGAAVVVTLTPRELYAGPVTIYATELTNNGGALVSVNTTTNAITVVDAGASGPDSLIFSGSNILFTNVFAGDVSLFNGTTNTILQTGLSIPQDLTLDPGGATYLVSDTGNGRILRQSVTGGSVATLATPGNPTGLAYDPAGQLFVVNGSDLLQIDPTTGATINTFVLGSAGDGLAYDPFTGNLFVSFTSGIEEVPTSLSGSGTTFAYNGDRIDGLESDGLGNIYLADTDAQRIVEFNIGGSSFTPLSSVPTIDDLAPVVGPGSAPVPEPATLTLTALGLAGIVTRRARRRSRSAS
jgi:PEP-CTERM motif